MTVISTFRSANDELSRLMPDRATKDEFRQLRRTISQVDQLTWTACLLLSIFSLLGGELARSPLVQWAPWIVGIFIMSLPHGGMDDATTSVLRGEGLRRPRQFAFYLLYLGLVGAVVIWWEVRADLALLGFILISGYHFGQGDVYWSQLNYELTRQPLTRQIEERTSQSHSSRLSLLLARGGIAALLPFIYHDQQFLKIVRQLSEESGQAITIPAWVVGQRSGALMLIGSLILGQIWFSIGQRRGRNMAAPEAPRFSQKWREILETGILVTLFLAAPPILSIGAYILFWHAPRHIWRLILLDHGLRGLVVKGRGLAALRQFHLRSLPIVLSAAVLLLLITLISIQYDFAPERLILPAFIFVNAITVPHILTVSRLDLFQKIWK